jgi:hypothetical protein
MIIYQREPIFTVGQAPFVAGEIQVRNQIRILKQRQKARIRKAFAKRVPLLRIGLRRTGSLGRTGLKPVPPPKSSPVIANA